MSNIFFRVATFAGAACLFAAHAALGQSAAVQRLPDRTAPAGFGVNVHWWNPPQQEEIDRFVEGGYPLARQDLSWARIEKTPGVYDFRPYDTDIDIMTQHGIRPLIILAYGNKLYDGGLSPYTDKGRAAFAAFASAAATRFRGRGILWEIWNEPNGSRFWQPHPNAADYAAMAIPAARAIHAADPTALVLAPGAAKFPWQFLDTVFRAGLLHEIDAVSVHPYRESNPETAQADFAHLRRLIAADTSPGDPVRPIVCSEWGYSTFTGKASGFLPMTEDQQARYLSREWLSNLAAGVDASIYYDWHDDGANPAELEDHFGTVHTDFTPKPAFLAAKALIHDLAGFRFVHNLPGTADSDHEMLFAHGRDLKVVSWSSDPAASDDAQTPHARTVTASDPDAATLRRSAAFDYGSGILAANPYRPGEMQVTLSNPESAAAMVKIDVAGAVKTVRVLGNAPQTIDFTLPVSLATSGSAASLPIQAWWNGAVVDDLPPVSLQAGYPISIAAAPSGSGLHLELGNRTAKDFHGEIRCVEGGKTETLPADVPAGGSGVFTAQADPTQPVIVSAVDREGVTLGRLGPVSFEPLAGFPMSGGFVTARYMKTGPSQWGKPSLVDAVAGGPSAQAVPLAVDPDPNWQMSTFQVSKPLPIPSDATGLVFWVYSDGIGLTTCARFKDSAGQTFQPNLPALTWTGWRAVTVPFSGEMWHWGGVNDGVPHGALTLDTVLLVDASHASVSPAGHVMVADPCFALGDSSEPDIPQP